MINQSQKLQYESQKQFLKSVNDGLITDIVTVRIGSINLEF
jgi:hypothetical protein